MGKRNAYDYGLQDLPDETLQALAGNPHLYGEKSRFAAQELAGRRGIYSEADRYRAALEKATFGDFGRQYGAGLGQITNYLARSGPLADSGAATALRAKLASQLYGQAQSRIGGGYADYLAQLLKQRRGYGYQAALQRMSQNQNRNKSVGSWIGSALGGVGGAILGGPAGAAAGYQIGGSL
jgi:hypothetical protein